jgi:hypothetical protein
MDVLLSTTAQKLPEGKILSCPPVLMLLEPGSPTPSTVLAPYCTESIAFWAGV